MNKLTISIIMILVATTGIVMTLVNPKSEWNSQFTKKDVEAILARDELEPTEGVQQNFFEDGLLTNTAEVLISLDEVVSGGPGKDGIPAISDPKFVKPGEEELDGEVLGILVEGKKENRFYPYTVLFWHEIVNDEIDGEEIAVTFCPLCGSAIVYDREVDGEVYEFGVSGKLWQSNLLMYDRTMETLWSQAEGRALVGDLIGSELALISSHVMAYDQAQALDKKLKVLSSDTGYTRDYGVYPYGDYENTDELYFPVGYKDISLPLKTLVQAAVVDGIAVAFNRDKLLEEKNAVLETSLGNVTAVFDPESSKITITDDQGTEYPGYVTMWFSWANHNKVGVAWK